MTFCQPSTNLLSVRRGHPARHAVSSAPLASTR